MTFSRVMQAIGALWSYLTSPPDIVTDKTQRLEFRLFLGLLIVVLSCVLIGAAFYPYAPLLILATLLILAYSLSRSRYYYAGLLIFLFALTVTPFYNLVLVPLAVTNASAELMWLVIPLLASGMLLSRRSTFLLMVIYVLLILVVAHSHDIALQSEFGRLVGLLISVSVAVITYKTLLQQAEIELDHYRLYLEELVEARTLELNAANQQITTALTEKVVLLQEIHHRVKNNMQVIVSLLNLQASRSDSETVRSLFLESQHRIQSMALVHEHLYQASDLSQIGFERYVQELLERLSRSYNANNINLVIDVERISLDIDKAIPYGLIVNELVSNAYKHAFPDGRPGQIEVRIHPSPAGTSYMLVVEDNGIGLPQNASSQHGNSLGLQLVRSLVMQVGGTLEIVNNHGACFVLKLPAADAPE